MTEKVELALTIPAERGPAAAVLTELRDRVRGVELERAAENDPTLANTLLTALGLRSEPMTFAPVRSPPQPELAWDEAL